MAARRNSFGLAQLAADSAPRIVIPEGFKEAFSLVIGDTFADRVVYWNDRGCAPAYLGREFTTLIVSPARLEDPDFFAALVAFINARNGVHRPNSNPWVILKSTSLELSDLARLRDRFNAADRWNSYQVPEITSIDGIVPSDRALKSVIGLVTGRFFDRSASWKEFSASSAAVRPPPSPPSPISGIQNPSRATEGVWALDLDIERQNNLTRYSNVTHKWCLPRRLRMHGAFRVPYEGPKGGRTRRPRSTKGGYLVLFTGFGEDPPTITLPDDEAVFRHAIEQGLDWLPFLRKERMLQERGAYAWSRPSDKGRYLTSTLRLFGSLHDMGQVLLHDYWRAIFADLGGAIGNSRHEIIKGTLKKRLRKGSLSSEDEWDRVAAVVASEAHHVRLPLLSLSFDQLRRRFEPFLEQERKLLEEQKTEDPESWMKSAEATLSQSVKHLCSRSVLYQGHQWRCSRCYNMNWNDIGSLRPILACEVCGAESAFPVDHPWHFRLNGFVRDALKEHGLLPLIWCLVQLERQARESFFFLGPHELFLDFPDSDRVMPNHEADLICVVDGRVHLCEVKSSKRDVDLDSLVQVAQRLKPDTVTLAIMEHQSDSLADKLTELKESLLGTDIRAELLTLSADAFSDDARLPY